MDKRNKTTQADPFCEEDEDKTTITKLTNDEIGRIASAVREALATPEDKRSMEDIIRSVFAVKCCQCGYWIDRSIIARVREPYLCSECCGCGQ